MAITLTNIRCTDFSGGGTRDGKVEFSASKIDASEIVECLSDTELAELIREIGEERCCNVLEITPAEVE